MTWPLVVGLGSHHGDDQAGWLVLDRLRERNFPAARLTRILHPVDLLDVSDPQQSLILCDACRGSGAPGDVSHCRWPSDHFIITRHSGSHDLSLREVLELGQQLGRLPQIVEIWTIEGAVWSPGSPPSADVERAAIEVAEQLWGRDRA